jgi:hypothetical protein
LRSDIQDHVPLPGETAAVGYVEREGGDFVECAKTRAWCHQQGSMLQWLKTRPGAFIFNDYDLDAGKLVAKVFMPGKGVVFRYERPIYIISPDGRHGLSLNFSRLPRRGYSYADVPVPKERRPDLDADGLFLVDMLAGSSRLLFSYRQILERHPFAYGLEGEERHWWLDHPGFNSSSDQVLFLFRDCADVLNPHPWHTHMFTARLDGSGLACTLPDVYWKGGAVSHQLWGRGPDEILVDANWNGAGNEYVVFDNSERPFRAKRISKGMGPMAHLIFSPDGKWLLADTYPDERDRQRLALVEVATGRLKVIGEFRHKQRKGLPIDVRCDLHPRWSADGSLITVDSIDAGTRDIYLLEFSPELMN